MKKLTALIITLVFVMAVVVALPAHAADESIVVSASSTSDHAAVTNGKNVNFNFDLTESGTYMITAKQISWNATAGYKLFVNSIPCGVVSVENTLDEQQETEIVLGNFELLDGANRVTLYAVEAPKSLWLYNITLTKVDELKGNSISLIEGNSRFTTSTQSSGMISQYGNVTGTIYVPVDGNYEVYYASDNDASKASQVDLLYKNPEDADFTKVASIVPIPSHDRWGTKSDMAYIGVVPLVAGENGIKLYLEKGTRSNPAGIMIKRVKTAMGDLSSALGSNGKLNKGTKLVTMTIPEKGKYAIMADVAGMGSQEHTVKLYKYSETANWNIGTTIGTIKIQSPEVLSSGYGSWIGETVLAVGEFDTTDTRFWIENDIAGMGIRNLKLVNVEAFKPKTNLYLGTEATATKEITTLRAGTVTVQTTLTDEAQDAVMIAALFENGEIVDVNKVEEKVGATLTCTLDTTKASNIAASYIKVFVWDSFDKLTPLTTSLVR